jgi:hypothetical protein
MAKGKGDLSYQEASLLLVEALDSAQVTIELSTLNELHDEVDSEFILEYIVHAHDEGMLHSVEDVLLKFQRLKEVLINNHILSDTLHSKDFVGVTLLYHVHLAERTFTDHLHNNEIL